MLALFLILLVVWVVFLSLALIGTALTIFLKVLAWMLQLGIWLMEPRAQEPEILINIVDDYPYEEPTTMRDITPRVRRIR